MSSALYSQIPTALLSLVLLKPYPLLNITIHMSEFANMFFCRNTKNVSAEDTYKYAVFFDIMITHVSIYLMKMNVCNAFFISRVLFLICLPFI